MIKTKIIADSINPQGSRITTFVVSYPRFIHSELKTHRALSTNSASSRAIPFEKQVARVETNPALPEWWGKNQKGMQANVELDPEDKATAITSWTRIKDMVVKAVKAMAIDVDLHKQIINRALEPWSHIETLITATEWHNFFALRAEPGAQPEFQVLAYRMLARYLEHKPTLREVSDWHIPFGDDVAIRDLSIEDKLKVATARAARISYMAMDGKIDIAADIALHDRLVTSGHMSPTEHCAQSLPWCQSGNFRGWRQYRKLLERENRSEVDLKVILSNKPNWISLEE